MTSIRSPTPTAARTAGASAMASSSSCKTPVVVGRWHSSAARNRPSPPPTCTMCRVTASFEGIDERGRHCQCRPAVVRSACGERTGLPLAPLWRRSGHAKATPTIDLGQSPAMTDGRGLRVRLCGDLEIEAQAGPLPTRCCPGGRGGSCSPTSSARRPGGPTRGAGRAAVARTAARLLDDVAQRDRVQAAPAARRGRARRATTLTSSAAGLPAGPARRHVGRLGVRTRPSTRLSGPRRRAITPRASPPPGRAGDRGPRLPDRRLRVGR